MKNKYLISILVILVLTLVSCNNIDYKAAENYIIKSADDWAQAIAIGDSVTIDRIMADDFRGISSRGTFERKNLSKPEVYDVTVRFYDKAAVAQGYETWTSLSDSTSTRSIWTDTWIYRKGKWQIVAAQDHKFKK